MATPNVGPRLTGEERSIGQLVSDATQEISGIFKSEIELAKTEIKTDVAHGGKGIGMFVGAAVFGLFFLGFALTGAVYGLAETGLPLWACWLIVAGVLLLITLILALLGKSALGKVKGKPEKTIAHGQATVAALKDGKAGGDAKVAALKSQIEAEKAVQQS